MALFQVVVREAAPLCIQLTAGSCGVRVEGWDAFGSNELGTTSLPTLYFPSSPGQGRLEDAWVVQLDKDYLPSDARYAHTAQVITNFSVPPSPVEVAGPGSAGVPMRSSMRGLDMWIPPGETVVLFASTPSISQLGEQTASHKWNATLTWEEEQ